MRLKLGRPDLSDYRGLFDQPAATATSPLTVTWAGVTTLLVDDGDSALMTDGFFSRPSILAVGTRKIAPLVPRIDGCLARLNVDSLEAVLPVHTHFDHAMDSAVVAQRTGARLVGGTSAAHLGRGAGLPDDRLVVATPGEPISLGRSTSPSSWARTARRTASPVSSTHPSSRRCAPRPTGAARRGRR